MSAPVTMDGGARNEVATSVTDAVSTRRAVRAFSSRPVDPALVRRLLDAARQSPSGGNVQPWNLIVLGGEPLAALEAHMRERLAGGLRSPEGPGYAIYPRELPQPYATRREQCTEDMYATMGIARTDKPARIAFVKGNFAFFGAPVGMFVTVERCMGPPQWSDLGMYIQTLMLLAREAGLHSCPQEAWTNWAATVEAWLGLPPTRMIFCGLALGYADEQAPVNRLRTRRAPLGEIAEFRGI